MTRKLFSGRIPPACQYCEKAMKIMENQVLCLKKGVVPLDYSCRKYSYDPTKRIPQRPVQLDDFQAQDFSIT